MTERRRALEVAMRDVVQTADPQTEAATHIVTWLTGGLLKPTGDDFAMVRLILLALLPQIGGILLMVGPESQRRLPKPSARAFCLKDPSVLFISFAIFTAAFWLSNAPSSF